MRNFNMKVFRLFVLFVIKYVVLVSASDIKFAVKPDFDGFTCPEKATLFKEDKLSKVKCLAVCAEMSACFGVFFDQVNLHCVGCGDKFLTCESATPSLNGTKYFQRLGKIFL